MTRLNGYRMRLMLVGVAAVIMLGGSSARGDFAWTQKADMPIKKLQHSTSVVGGKIYSIGGWYAIGESYPVWEALTRVDEYDPTTDTWTRKADMPTGRGHTSAAVVNEKIYIIGGDASEAPIVSIVEVYDPCTDTWAEQTELPSQRYWFSTIAVDGIIYVIGGNEGLQAGYSHLNTVEAYDTSTDTWTRKADMPTSRSFLSTSVVNGLIYAIGGGAPGKEAVEVYDPTTDTWTTKAPMPTTRYGLDAVVVDGKIYAIGGWYFSLGGPIYSTVEVYDPQTDIWTKGLDIPVTTAGLTTNVVDGKIYVMGGATAPHDNENWILTSAVYESDIIVDFNGDGIVDVKDVVILTDHWGENYSLCDIGPTPLGDGIVDVEDLKVLAEHLFEEVDDPTLIAHWPLDEVQSAIAYNGAADCDGTLMGGPVWQPDGGMVAGALQFDGMDDYVSTDPVLNPSDGKFSVVAWIVGGAPGQAVLSQADGANWLCTDSVEGYLITELKASGRSAAGPLLSQTVITDGEWHRMALVWDGSCRHLYVDGVEVAKDTAPLSALEDAYSGLYFGVGSTLAPGTFFSGLIDDMRIYNRAVKP